uniref:Uncharacterized protein n=1 Tax=Siphoviridae sp. ct5jB2 TaxID=2825337 RepID=A0A8S5TTY2_9CAUD|nr:MAG TPA: hypothetical protein [Siphoviridae sp. ct5jB2]
MFKYIVHAIYFYIKNSLVLPLQDYLISMKGGGLRC